MPKYEALTLLLARDKEKYIQPGEVFEIDNPETEAILLNAGCIKAAVIEPIEEDPAPADKKSKSKTVSGGSS